jgi:hypothetical protein
MGEVDSALKLLDGCPGRIELGAEVLQSLARSAPAPPPGIGSMRIFSRSSSMYSRCAPSTR